MAKQQQNERIVYVERREGHGLLWFILFGWWYVGWLALKWCGRVVTWPFRFAARVGWDVIVKWPWDVTVAACRWSVRGVRALLASRD